MHFTLIGAGRIGCTLAELAESYHLVRRGEAIPDINGPIVVCTRNKDLAAVVNGTPIHRREDLLFVQNGMLESWLAEQNLRTNSQALLYFAVAKKGDKPQDGGRSAVCGKWAKNFAQLLERGGICCQILERDAYRRRAVEKFLWICVMALIGQRFDCTVGEALNEHQNLIQELSIELADILCAQLEVELEEGVVDRLVDYSATIPEFRSSLKEWSWRNGWIWERKQSLIHGRLLKEVGAI